jgi:hypothetical protein
VAGIPELICSGIDGLLVPPYDTEALAEPSAGSLLTPICGWVLVRQVANVWSRKFDLRKSSAVFAEMMR